ncbi:MAG: ATP-grasp domain-containing protein [Variibacter sp.]|nr:ATP-grasp domain-containing protein [Variibacter sp.]
MFSSVLIANRGEIACRVVRTAKRLGLRTIAVYSDADANALHVRLADEAHYIGPAPARESYLVAERLIAVGRKAGAECVHPGYGFLAENAEFAEAVAAAGMTFVGPPPAAIRAMGLKDAAKALMEKAGVPVVPGYHGELQDPRFLKEKAYEIGYPVLIKPVAGGGGKGMRRVDRHADFEEALQGAMREAAAAFGDSRVLIEKYISAPRHVEIQIFADAHGHCIHLNERDCSLQRRHQKVIEEAPAPGMTPAVRGAMGAAAVAAARAVGYVGAGTVEFIAAGAEGLQPDAFWFLEMNTRLQVEHPVTEAVTGIDLVEWQFRIAAGERLPLAQDEVPLVGHAVEARLYAEDPTRGFVPSTGRLVALEFPRGEGLRVDSGVEAGMTVTPYYDPMIAKIVAHGADRTQALDRLAEALERTLIAGPRSNAAFLAALARAPAFRAGDFDTGFIDRHLADLAPAADEPDRAAAAAAVAALVADEQRRLAREAAARGEPAGSPWLATDGFALAGSSAMVLPVLVDGERRIARVAFRADGPVASLDGVVAAEDVRLVVADGVVYALRRGRQTVVQIDESGLDHDHGGGDGVIRAPMHGKLLALLVDKNAAVDKGHRLAVIEAMKMEHTLVAPFSGVVVEISATAGQQVAEGAVLMVLAPTV